MKLLINENKSNNFDVKSNNELFKQALVEGVNRHIDKTIEKEKQIEEMELTEVDILANDINQHCADLAENYCGDTHCVTCLANALYNAGYRKQSDKTPCTMEQLTTDITYLKDYRKQSEWISVEDRLPEESGEYLVFGRTFGNKKPQIWICECINIGSVMGWCNNAKNPIIEAWMPLPEAPKMKGGEG